MESQGFNWLWHTKSECCGWQCGPYVEHRLPLIDHGGWGGQDVDPFSLFSRCFVVSMYAMGTLAVVVISRRGHQDGSCGYSSESTDLEGTDDQAERAAEERHPLEPDDADKPESAVKGEGVGPDAKRAGESRGSQRFSHFDFARVFCVGIVVTEHSGGANLTDVNLMWGQQWVIPFLYLISGAAFQLSSASLVAYELRLLAVFVVGVAANWCADLMSHRNDDVPNTIFQMGFLLVLMGYAFISWPVREALRRHNAQGHSAPSGEARLRLAAWTSLCGVVCLVSMTLLSTGVFSCDSLLRHAAGTSGLADLCNMPRYVSEGSAMMFWALLACLLRCRDCGWVVWIMLTVRMLNPAVVPVEEFGHPALDTMLFICGMVNQSWPLEFGTSIARAVRSYWPILLAGLMMTSTDVRGRCDMHPLNYWWERLRFQAIEFVLIVVFLSGGLQASDPYRWLGWMNRWALYAFVFHIAWARLLPAPYGALVTYISALPFYAWDRWSKRAAH